MYEIASCFSGYFMLIISIMIDMTTLLLCPCQPVRNFGVDSACKCGVIPVFRAEMKQKS